MDYTLYTEFKSQRRQRGAEPVDPDSLETKETKKAKKMANLLMNQAFEATRLTNPAIEKAIQLVLISTNTMILMTKIFLMQLLPNTKWIHANFMLPFTKGLEKDFEAIRNMLRHLEISNGVVEGLNNYTKKTKRSSLARSKLAQLLCML
jgi:transposase